jgi:hypothetical protein
MNRRSFIAKGCAVIGAAISTPRLNLLQAKNFTITVHRQYPGEKCISGYLAITKPDEKERIICYTVEKPWADNKKNVSSIPEGTYSAHLRYDHADHWRIELDGVPDRDNVQIHIGNSVNDSAGCLLVGLSLGPDLCSIVGGTSKPAYEALKEAFYGSKKPFATPNLEIAVAIQGNK